MIFPDFHGDGLFFCVEDGLVSGAADYDFPAGKWRITLSKTFLLRGPGGQGDFEFAFGTAVLIQLAAAGGQAKNQKG